MRTSTVVSMNRSWIHGARPSSNAVDNEARTLRVGDQRLGHVE